MTEGGRLGTLNIKTFGGGKKYAKFKYYNYN